MQLFQEPHRRANDHLRARGPIRCRNSRILPGALWKQRVGQDINSRTVLREGEAGDSPPVLPHRALRHSEVNDVLLELLEDESLQSAIQQQAMPLSTGHRYEAEVR